MSERTQTELQSKSSKGSLKTLDESNFDCNSPRPPVPGQEKTHEVSEWAHNSGNIEWNKCRSSSPAPRKQGNDPIFDGYSNGSHHANTLARPEEMSKHVCNTSNEPPRNNDQSNSPPACLRWAQSLHTLLRDSDGVELFLQYLENEGRQHADVLHFWFACEGLRKQWEPEKVHQLVKVIYKKFFVKSALPINEELRKEIAKNIKSSSCLEPPVTLFDEAQTQLENLINKTTYPNFLKSDIYLQYLQSVQNPSSGSAEFSSESSTSSSLRDLGNIASGVGPLPTLHEDLEFVPPTSLNYVPTSGTNANNGNQNSNFAQPVRLTKDMLLISQKHRAVDVRPKSEAFAGLFPYRPNGNLHAAYNSYNPVSRQDSEMQSLSSHSDARTESDNLSLPDSSLVDGGRNIRSKRKSTLEARHVREWAAANRECQLRDQPLIPRTQRPDARTCAQPMRPEDFAAILAEKLQAVKRDQDLQERLERKLKEGELQDEKNRKSELQSRALANAIKEKLQLEDDNDQDILDQHVSRVFSDLTPCRSPGIVSPRTHSPHRNRYNQVSHIRDRSKRRDKDGFSTFSGDSGNIHDFADGSEHRMSMVKSKSMPDYADDRFIRGSAGRRSSSKKTLADLTDSGVSVVSDVPPAMPNASSTSKDNNRVLAWLLESDRTTRSSTSSGPYSEISQKHRGSHRSGPTSTGYLATSPTAGRHRSKGYGSSRSNSLERAMAANQPAQPFVADPTMPPPPLPNTTIQLEEARRRLMDDDFRNRSRLRSSNKYYPEMSQSVQSTLRKSNRQMRPSLPAPMHQSLEEFTTVVFSYSDEQFPYRTKIPGTQVTFKQFKEFLPKKGNYRYFFKTVCEELGNQVIQEEVNRDSDILPLWEGKIMAQAKPVD